MQMVEGLVHWCQEHRCLFLREEPMARHTTMRVGGPAELLVQPNTLEQLQELRQRSHQLGIPTVVMGNGSNLLVSDQGVRGLVILLAAHFSSVQVEGDCVQAQAGASINKVCQTALEHGLTGLEFAWGIPASMGGGVYMNAGAYGGEMKDVLRRVWLVSPSGELAEYGVEELSMSYRHTKLMEEDWVVASAEFQLQPGRAENIRARMEELLERRKSKQPLEYPSSGSTFKRPEGAFAAQLIDECGCKGLRVGGAMVSKKHAGFLINYDHATCSDVLALIAEVQRRVREQTGCQLECEVRQLGDF